MCKYKMSDCLHLKTFKCNDCKDKSNYKWDHTEIKYNKEYKGFMVHFTSVTVRGV